MHLSGVWITMSDVVIVAIITGCCSLLAALIPMIVNAKSAIHKKVDKIAADLETVKTQQDETSDIVYQMLDHMATNNNTGNMKRCLDAYVKFNIHH